MSSGSYPNRLALNNLNEIDWHFWYVDDMRLWSPESRTVDYYYKLFEILYFLRYDTILREILCVPDIGLAVTFN